jgi:hypothetical protein
MVGAVCSAPALLLKPVGVLDEMNIVTGNPLAIKMPEQSWPVDYFTSILGDKFDASFKVISDEKQQIVRSQIPGTAIEYEIVMVDMLCGEECANRISNYIFSTLTCVTSINHSPTSKLFSKSLFQKILGCELFSKGQIQKDPMPLLADPWRNGKVRRCSFGFRLNMDESLHCLGFDSLFWCLSRVVFVGFLLY